jgi:excinuclease UvrABC helicase subunit UvrB
MLVEKRIRKYVRAAKAFRGKDNILAVGDLAFYFAKKITDKMPVKIFKTNKEDKTSIRKNRINKIIPNWTIDDEINDFLEQLLNKKENHKKPSKVKEEKILSCITDEEASLFAEINSISFKPNKKNKDISEFVEELVKKHPHSKFSLISNIRELESVK